MSDCKDQDNRDLLDRATDALRGAQVPNGPPPQLLASTVEALETLDKPPDTVRFRARRSFMFRMLRYGGVAAAVLLAILAGSLLFDRNASFSFAQVVDNVNKAKTVSFVVKQKLGNQPELEAKMYIKEEMVRYEIMDLLLMILDTNQRKGLQLDVHRKVASKIDLEGRLPAEELKDPIDRLRDLKENSKDHVTELGIEELDGRKCRVYQVKGRSKNQPLFVGDEFKLWVDEKTGLPVKIHYGDANTSVTFEQFRWGEPLKDELFSLKVPEGYRLEELTPAVIKPGRIYYHQGWVELYSIQPDGRNPEVQFVPRRGYGPAVYLAEMAELSPNGRYQAIAYTRVTNKSNFSPDQVLLWDRTRPKDEFVEVYHRPEAELQSWQFSADGQRLYVSWWEAVSGKNGAEGRTGTDVVHLKTKARQPLQLPRYRDTDGQEKEMLFAAASTDGQTYLVIGQGLHSATAQGKLLRRLSAPNERSFVAEAIRLSPDGKQAVYATFHAADRNEQLFLVSLASENREELTPPGKFTDLRARWSPDGKRIAYSCRLLDTRQPPLNFGTESFIKVVDAGRANTSTLLTKKVHPAEASLQLTAWR